MKILLVILIVLPLSSLAQSLDSIDISRHIHPIEEVVVTGSNVKSKTSVLSSALTIIERKSIDNDNRPSLLPTLSEQVPGLFITARGVMGYGVSTGAAGGMSIRGIGGSPTTGVMVLIDGHPQHMGLMGHPIADTYQSILAERVEVVRGPASALYGSNAMGGVINIVTDRALQHGSRTKLHAGYGSFNTLQTNLTNQIHKKAFSSTATISYNRSDGHRKDMAFEQYGGSLRIGLELSQNWEATANTNITHFNASNPGPITAPIIDNDSHITRTTSAISINNNFTRTQGSISLYYNWGQHKINDGYSAGSQPLDYRFHSQDRVAGASIYQNFSTFNKGTVTIGFDYQYAGGQAANHYISSSEDKLIAKKQMHNSAAYINLNQTILQWLTLNASLRYDYNSRVGDEWIPQLSAAVRLPHNMEIKALISKGFRFPTIREMYMFPSQNPNLRSEQIINYELSLRQNIKTINYGINIYYIDGKDIIQTLIVDSRPQNINTANISNFGIETDITWQATKRWQVAANYSYINMKYSILATPKHKLFIMARYAYKRWSIGSSIQLIDGLITELNPIQQESYTLWNADIQFSASHKTSIYIRAENLLGTKYEINVGYPMPGTTINVGVKLTI